MLTKLSLLFCSAVIAIIIVTPVLSGNICDDVPEFNREKLIYLVSHNLIDDTDLELLTQAKTHQLSPTKTRALYLALNDLYNSTRRHRTPPNSFFSVSRLAALTVISFVGTFFYLMVTGEKKPQTPAANVPNNNAAGQQQLPRMTPEAAMEHWQNQLHTLDQQRQPPPPPVFEPLTIQPPLRSPEDQAYDQAKMEELQRNTVPIVYDTSPGTEAAATIEHVANGCPYDGIAKDITQEELAVRRSLRRARDAATGGLARSFPMIRNR